MEREPRAASRAQEIRLSGRVSDAARLRWFVNFAQPGPRRPTSRAEQRLIGKLRDYVRDVGLRRDGRGQDTNPFTLPLRPEEDHKSVAEKLALVQSTIRTLLRQHLSHGKRRPEANVALRLTVSEDGDVSRQIETDDLRDAVAYVLLLELAQFGRRVRRCTNPACQRFFVRERRQRYCSVICRNRATFKRWYRRHVGLMSRDSGKTAIVMRHRTAHKRARATRRLVA